ncbi:MAG: hypothetical protein ND895_19400 [Pyrinomonadaceae bacterium]|nr:hypothetical protein [Pyrinomonadaceae bacterium]
MKIIAVIVLVLGIGLSALGAGFLFSSDSEVCQSYNRAAEEKLREADAARGTPREAELINEARMEVDSAERACRNAKRTQQSAMLAGPGGLAAIIVAVLLLVMSGKRRHAKV